MKKRCHNCGERVALAALAVRSIGGNYRRAPHGAPCNICLPCAERIVGQAQGYAMETISRWSVFSVSAALHKMRAA